MIYKVYSIRDVNVGFMTPVCEINEACAVRNFEFAVGKENTLLYSHAKDYDLYEIGTYDDESGLLTSTIPKIVISGVDAKRGVINE